MAAGETRETVYVDPHFYIPDGMTEWVYRADPTDEVSDDGSLENSALEAIDVPADVTVVDESNATIPEMRLFAPDSVVVALQQIRRLPDGSQVVDIILEVDDVAAATKYEVRVTKL